MSGNHFVTKRFQKRKYPLFNNRHFGYPETKITDFKISGTRLGTTLRYCRLILETETEPGTKSCFHYLCPAATNTTPASTTTWSMCSHAASVNIFVYYKNAKCILSF